MSDEYGLDEQRAKTLDETATNRTRVVLLLRLAASRQRAGSGAFYDCGEALRSILRDRLYEATGHRSFAAMIDASGFLRRSQAWKLVKVVETFPRVIAARLGVEKAYALARFAERTGQSATALAEAGLIIDGQHYDLSEVTVRVLQRAGRPPLTEAQSLELRAARNLSLRITDVLRAAGLSSATALPRRRRDRLRIHIELTVGCASRFFDAVADASRPAVTLDAG